MLHCVHVCVHVWNKFSLSSYPMFGLYFYKSAIVSSASIKMGVNDYECFASLNYVRELYILIIWLLFKNVLRNLHDDFHGGIPSHQQCIGVPSPGFSSWVQNLDVFLCKVRDFDVILFFCMWMSGFLSIIY